MTNIDDNNVKILFRFYSDFLEEETVERMWATVVDRDRGLFKLDNIPFYAQSVASEDIVFAEYDETEKMLTFREIKEHSGNSTIQVVIMDKNTEINEIRNIFKKFGCPSERMYDHYFVMAVPSIVDYKIIKVKLDELEANETIGYIEACLADRHKI